MGMVQELIYSTVIKLFLCSYYFVSAFIYVFVLVDPMDIIWLAKIPKSSLCMNLILFVLQEWIQFIVSWKHLNWTFASFNLDQKPLLERTLNIGIDSCYTVKFPLFAEHSRTAWDHYV